MNTYRNGLWRKFKFKFTYLLGCFVVLQQVEVPEAKTFRIPEFLLRSLFIEDHYLLDFFNQWSWHFRDNPILLSWLSSCLNFLEGKIKRVLEWRTCLALLHGDKDPIAIAHSLLSHRVVGIEELVAANRHTSKDICGFLCLTVLNELHRRYALVKHEYGQEVFHEAIIAIRLLF